MGYRRVVALVAGLALAAGCASSDTNSRGTGMPPVTSPTTPPASSGPGTTSPGSTSPGTGTPTTAAPTTESTVPATSSPWGGTAPSNPVTGGFTILVTNDDGISADGIDVMVNSLSKVPNAKIVVVAPATNKSGTSDTTTPGGAKGHDAATKGGVKGTAVDGYPADTVIYALDVLGLKPDLVVSGTNSGVNFGPFVPISGTIGAAREAARRGIPAIAVSGGTDDITSFKAAALLTIDEIAARRGVLGFGKNAARTVVSINVPNCAAGTRVRGIVDAPVSTAFTPGGEGPNMNFDCSSTAINPVDDVTALDIGFASRSIIPAEL